MKRDRPTGSDETRERLLLATIAEIEQHGLAQLTVRSVASAAGANVAAVNYHFRSKDALVEAALELSIANMMSDLEVLLARVPSAPEAVLSELLAYLLEGGLKYPQLGRAHLHEGFVSNRYDGPFPRAFGPVLVQLREALEQAVPGLDARSAARRVTCAISAVLFPSCFRGLFAPLDTLASTRDRQRYARELARSLLQPPD